GAAIPCGAQSIRRLVPQHSNTRVGKPAEHRRSVVGGTFVDNDDLELNVLLAEYAAQRHRQETAAIACRHDDRNPAEIHHLFAGLTDYLACSRRVTERYGEQSVCNSHSHAAASAAQGSVIADVRCGDTAA